MHHKAVNLSALSRRETGLGCRVAAAVLLSAVCGQAASTAEAQSPEAPALDGATATTVQAGVLPQTSAAAAADPVPAGPTDPQSFVSGPWTIKVGIFAGSQVAAEDNGFWGLSDVFAPTANYSKNRVWNESWLVPSVRLTYAASDTVSLYGGLALAATGNLGRDVFEQGNSGRVSLEEGYGGIRLTDRSGEVTLDLSGGQQGYRIGSGMLVDLGAQNGNQRGAALVSPRRSWEYTGLARLNIGRLSVDGFVLNYNQIGAADPDTTLAGGKVEYRLSEAPGDEFAGLAYICAVSSTMPYISAPLTILENGREGTQTINPYLRLRPLGGEFKGLFTALEGAYQWNSRTDLAAWAVSAEIGHQWESAPLRPKLSYAFRTFSGDRPGTSALERFDPLFYDGGVNAFASGSNAALAFYNTNVRTHRVSLNLTLSQQDFLTLSYWRVEAAEINSPLQFGQGGRLQLIGGQPALVSGVPTDHLSDDFYIEYVRAITANAYLTVGMGVSLPGAGLDAAAGRDLEPWIGGLVNVTFKF